MASYNLGKVVGDDGVSLEYDWEGTSLGIKRDDEEEYTYVDLKGEKGDAGSTGASGSDGYSPTVSTSKEDKTTTIEITDKNGTHTATIQDGADGTNGVDGTSPIATVSKSGNTATITITDKNGTTTTSVSDGVNGTDGRDGYVQYTAGDNITIENNVISATDTTYSAGSNISITNGEISADLSSKQDIIQYSTMPTASASNEGKIVQYIGSTGNEYTNGYFYECVENNSVYSWQNINIQPASSGGDIPIYIWDGRPWSSSTPETNADVKETWDKVIDCLLNGKPYSFYLIQTRRTGSSASTERRMVFNITLAYRPSNNSLYGGAICFHSGVDYYCYDISIINALDSNNKITSVPNKTTQTIYDLNIAPVYNGSNVGVLTTTNLSTYNPTANSYNPATTKYVDNKPTTYSGYDATKTQVLKNINGTLTWVDE